MLKICIADNHEVVRLGLKMAIREVPDLQIVGEAADDKELFKVLTADIQVLVMALSLPGRPGLELLEEVKSRFPKLAVIVFTIHNETALAVGAVKAGASGYLTKDCRLSEVIAGIRKAAEGRKCFTEDIAEKLANHLEKGSNDNPHQALSHRELQVMAMLSVGKSIKQIAQDLSVSPQTVTTYRARTLEKLGVQTNADLVRYSIQHRLWQPGAPNPPRLAAFR